MGLIESRTFGPSRLRVCVFARAEEAAAAAVSVLESTLQRQPDARIGLATGSTFAPVFARVLSEEAAGALDLGRATVFHLDEYLDVPRGSPGTMEHELETLLFSRLQTRPRRVVAVADALAREGDPAAALENAVAEFGPIDLQFLGLGRNGHVAFNEPGKPFSARTHVTSLTESTRRANAPRFAGLETPTRALTMGPATLMQARQVVLLATGPSKREALHRLFEGTVDPECPATLVRLHPEALVIVDLAAIAGVDLSLGETGEGTPFEILRSPDLRPAGPVLVISPHPDDASISCGGLLASLPSSAPRHILTMTTGARALVPGVVGKAAVTTCREEEVRREAEHLGATTSFFRGEFYDSGAFEAEDAARLATELERLAPAWILAPSLDDPHPTHRLSRQVFDDAFGRWRRRVRAAVHVWTFEGPWFQHPRDAVNTLVVFDAEAEAKKLAAVREHRSQMARVPFDEGASALARLRGVGFSESHFGGKEPGRLTVVPLVEAYVREAFLAG